MCININIYLYVYLSRLQATHKRIIDQRGQSKKNSKIRKTTVNSRFIYKSCKVNNFSVILLLKIEAITTPYINTTYSSSRAYLF